jgi:hypothetical protein
MQERHGQLAGFARLELLNSHAMGKSRLGLLSAPTISDAREEFLTAIFASSVLIIAGGWFISIFDHAAKLIICLGPVRCIHSRGASTFRIRRSCPVGQLLEKRFALNDLF